MSGMAPRGDDGMLSRQVAAMITRMTFARWHLQNEQLAVTVAEQRLLKRLDYAALAGHLTRLCYH